MTTRNDDIKDLKGRLLEIQPSVKKNLEILTHDDLGQDYVLHIAQQKFKEHVPNVSRRGAPSEDNTFPRVCVSQSLLECIAGHAATYTDHMSLDAEQKKFPAWYIYKIPFQCCVAPSKKLVYDSDFTNELWLVTYNKDTVSYPSSIVGKMYLLESHAWIAKKRVCVDLVYYLEVLEEFTFNAPKGKRNIVTPGYYKFLREDNVVDTDSMSFKQENDAHETKLIPVDEAEFKKDIKTSQIGLEHLLSW